MQELKDIADNLYKNNSLEEAIGRYSLVLDCEYQDKYKIYLNRCLCYFKLGNYEAALDDAVNATKLNKNNAKSWSRVGSCLLALDKKEDAKKAFLKAAKLEPSNNDYKKMASSISNDDSDTEDEDKVDINNLEKINIGNLLKSDLVNSIFSNMISNENLMNKLNDTNFQNKLLKYQKNPFAALKDKEMINLMDDVIGKLKIN